jgi:hypothetical protein
MAGLVWLFFRIVWETSGSIERALQGALVLGLATNNWFYATTFWTRPLATTCLMGSLLLVLVARERAAGWLLAGLALAYALVVRPEFAIAAPWLVGLAVLRAERRVRTLCLVLLPVLVAALALMAWNQHRFGGAFETGSIHQNISDFGVRQLGAASLRLLFGPREGVLRFVPVLLLGFLGMRVAWNRQRALLVTCVGVAATLVLFYASFTWARSTTPIAWGSRHLFALVPFLLLPAFLCQAHAPLTAGWAKLLVGISAILQLRGVLQRGRLEPPFWWMEDPGGAAVAGALALLLLLAVWSGARALDLSRRAGCR